ncbi:tumor necrosis factor receptor superfamily member 19L isoform 2-T2 [Chlamydotis macqueenii]
MVTLLLPPLGKSPPAMKRSGMKRSWWLVTILGVLSGSSAAAGSCDPRERGRPGCPPGEEPTACGSAPGSAGTCRACPPGTFSPGDASCSAHTRCWASNRILVAAGTAVTDSRCGACVPGFYSPRGEREPRGRCLPCAVAPRSTPGCAGRRRARSPETPDWPAGTNATWATLTGPSPVYQLEDPNEDTIGVLVRLITEKKENAVALEELLKEQRGQQPVPPPGCTPKNKLHLLPQFPPACRHQQHPHTVQGPAPCARCSQKKWPQVLPSLGATKVPKTGGHPGEVTILSVGRFRVSRIPETRSDPHRGPLPGSSGTRPPWLKSVEAPQELAPGLGAASGGR